MALAAASREKIARAIAARETFRVANVSGSTAAYTTGRLEEPWLSAYRDDDPVYTVFSYATPVSWFGRRGWIVPDVRYSVTTTHHQRVITLAIHNML